MKAFVFYFFFWCSCNLAHETALSFALKNINAVQAIEQLNSRLLPISNLTIGQKIADLDVRLSFNRENGHILLRADNEDTLIHVRTLIQHHIDN